MRVALTGSTGMIGLALTKLFIANNIEVIMFVRNNTKKISLIPESPLITIVKCDLSELCTFNHDIKADYFIHLGWDKTIGQDRNNIEIQNLNIRYTIDAINLAKRMNCKKFVGIGSQAEYGLHTTKLSIDSPCDPVTGYGIAKYCAGKFGKIVCDQLGLEFNWIRVLSVYGENDNPNTLISYVTKCLNEGISPDVTLCEQVWDYIEVNDAAEIIYKIMTRGKNGLVYPLGSGCGIILKDHLEKLREKINPNVKINYGAKTYPGNQVMYLVADMSYLENLK